MQDYAKQGYTFDHLSLIRNLALDIPSGVAIVKDRQNWVPFKKERFSGVLFRAPLFLGKWCRHLFFIQKNKKKNTNYKIHDWIVPFSSIE